MSKQKRSKFTTTATPEKTCPEKPLVELTEAQLEAIAGGFKAGDGCPTWSCGGNHNETMFVFAQLNLEDSQILKREFSKFLTSDF